MAQSALTVTAENPTPPTNLSFVGATPPLDPTQPAVDDGVTTRSPASVNEPSPLNLNVFAPKTAATGSGASLDHEGKGNETLFTQAYSSSVYAPIPLVMDGCGPGLTSGTMPNPNQIHASSKSPATNPTLTAIAPTTTASGTGTTLLTCTGTGFTPGCQIRVNNVPQATTFVSATSLTATVAISGAPAAWPVNVILGGVPVASQQTWTFT